MKQLSLSYFNTVPVAGAELKESVAQAKTQDNIVLVAFVLHKALTPSQCWKYLLVTGKITNHTPLTSIRRSITVLTKEECLKNTGVKKIGIFGRPENIWKYIF